MATNCFSSLQLCRMRVSLLDDAGAPDAGATSLVVTDAPIELGYKFNIKAGTKFDQEDGCGNACVTYQGDDRIESVDLALQLCTLDLELFELMTGGTLDTIGGNTRGFAVPNVTTDLTRRVSIEAWSKAWDGDQPGTDGAGNVGHWRFIFPSVSWVLADSSLANAAQKFPLNGHVRSNAGFGNGPANDLTWGVYTSPWGVFIDFDDLPDAVCGYQTLTAS